MSDKDYDEIPVTIENDQKDMDNQEEIDKQDKSEESVEVSEDYIEELKSSLEKEKQKSSDYENKLKYLLADFQNLEKKTKSDIENGIKNGIDKFVLDFLAIYDDFVRAKTSYEKSNIDTKGLESILKNMDSLLKKYNISPIEALGEVFDPNLHDAISVKVDPSLDEGTITQEIRKGYISENRVIRPTLVEISKKS